MKRIILGIILAFAASVAFASGNNNSNGQDQSQGQSQSSRTSTKTSTSTSTSTKQSQSADNKGNSQTVNEAKQRLQAPGMAVGGINPSATCMVGTSLGVSFPGGSIGGGTSVRDDICTRIEVAVKMIQVGQAIRDTDMVSDGRDMLRDVYADVRANQVGEKAKASETQPAFTSETQPAFTTGAY